MRAGPAARAVALVLSVAALAWAAARPDAKAIDRRPNVLLIVTDDQAWDSLEGSPPAMPWLTARLAEPGWLRFTQATVSTPVCCPSRVSILTGVPAWDSGVARNVDGWRMDPGGTVAARLHASGYTTGLVGKYLNGYPWGRGPHVPAGWDRWVAKLNLTEATTYYGFPVIDQTSALRVARTPQGYSTDWLGARAAAFVRTAPSDRPWFLAFTPSAPHPPFVPAPRHEGALADAPPAASAPDDAPSWGRGLPPIDAARAASIARQRLAARETLLAVDEAIQRLWAEVVARGEADRTVVILLSDNGFSFGEHRWVGKRCPSRACVQIPFVAYSPWAPGGVVDAPVSSLDVAPTVADLAGLTTPPGAGISLAPLLRGTGGIADRPLVSWYVGDAVIEPWWAVRDGRYALILAGDGTVELYDVARDPFELHDVAADRPRVVERLAAALPTEGRR